MALLGQLVVKVTGDATQFNSAVDKSHTKFSDVGKKIGKIALGIGVALTGIGVAAVKMASDAEETQNKFNVVFSSIKKDADDAAKNLAENFGLSSNAAKTLLSDTGDLLSGFGFTQEAALDVSKQVNELAVDLASFTNYAGGAEGASAALTKALLGERESVKSLGIAIMEKDVQERMAILATQGVTFETERQAKAYATLQIAQEQSKNAIGDFSRSSDSFANRLRVLNARIEDAGVQLGTLLLPVANDIIKIFTDLVSEITKNEELFRALSTAIKSIGAIIKNITPILSKLLTAITPIIGTLFELVAEIVNNLMPAIEAIIDLIIEILPVLKPLLQLFGNLVKIIAKLVSILVKLIVPLIKPLFKILESMSPILEPLIKGFAEFAEILDGPVVDAIINAISFILELLNPLSFITKALEELGVIEKSSADSIDKSSESASDAAANFDKYTKSLDKNIEKQEAVNTERLKIEQEWKENLFQLKASETEKIEAEYQKQIDAARKAGANTADIEEYYSIKQRELARKEIDEINQRISENDKERLENALKLGQNKIELEEQSHNRTLKLLDEEIIKRRELVDAAIKAYGEEDFYTQGLVQRLSESLLAREELEKQHADNVERILLERASEYKKFVDMSVNIFGDMFSRLGEALVTGENAWYAFAQAAVAGVASIIDALANEALAQAAAEFAKGLAALANPFTAALAPGFFSASAAWGSAGVVAKLGAGIVRGLASQIKLADGGMVMARPGGTVVTMAEAGVNEYAIPERQDVLQRLADKISENIGNTTNITNNNNIPDRVVINIDGNEFSGTLTRMSRDGQFKIDPNRGIAR
jgi:hypothetical protein